MQQGSGGYGARLAPIACFQPGSGRLDFYTPDALQLMVDSLLRSSPAVEMLSAECKAGRSEPLAPEVTGMGPCSPDATQGPELAMAPAAGVAADSQYERHTGPGSDQQSHTARSRVVAKPDDDFALPPGRPPRSLR